MESKIHVTTLIQIGFPSSKKKIPKNTTYSTSARGLFNPQIFHLLPFLPWVFFRKKKKKTKKNKNSLQQPTWTLDQKQPRWALTWALQSRHRELPGFCKQARIPAGQVIKLVSVVIWFCKVAPSTLSTRVWCHWYSSTQTILPHFPLLSAQLLD